MIEPCKPWITEQELPEDCISDAQITPQIAQTAIAMASLILFNRTKRRWPGECSDVWMPACQPRHCCYSILDMPAPLVRAITSVVIDGDVLAASDYELVYPNMLMRTGGKSWPCGVCCPSPWDATKFVITYTWGQDPPPAIKTITGIYAKEFALALVPARAGECRLPKAVQSVTRTGVSYQKRVDTMELMMAGDTGIPEVNAVLAAIEHGDRMSVSVMIPGEGGGIHLL